MSSISGNSKITATSPDGGSDEIGWAVHDNPGEVPTNDARQHRTCESPFDADDVAGVDSRGLDPNQYFVWTR
jgi:hypothetical protein